MFAGSRRLWATEYTKAVSGGKDVATTVGMARFGLEWKAIHGGR